MDAKSSKEKLKLAREAIQQKQFAEAIHLCQEVLEFDHRNYNALVFDGAARGGMKQPLLALKAYRIATEIEPTNGLAWQGICKVYETFPPDDAQGRSELIGAYEKLSEVMSSNEKKCFEIGVKLIQLYEADNRHQQAFSGCERLMASSEWVVSESLPVFRVLASALVHMEKMSEKQQELFKNACRVVISSQLVDVEERQSCVNNLFKLSTDVTLVWNTVKSAVDADKDDTFPLECLHRIYVDNALVGQTQFDLGTCTDCLLKLNPNSVWLKLVDGYSKLVNHDLTGARTALDQGIKVSGNSVSALFFYAKCMLGLHSLQSVFDSVAKAMQLLDGETVYFGDARTMRAMLKLLRAQACAASGESENWQLAVALCDELLSGSLVGERDVLVCKARALVKLGQFDESRKVIVLLMEQIKSSEVFNLDGYSKLQQNDLNGALSSFGAALELDNDSPNSHHYLGVVSWRQLEAVPANVEARNRCLRHLIQAAKLDPHFAETFLYLGYYYERIVQDLVKAKRCYQKAFELDGNLSEAGSSYVGCLMELNEKEVALQFLKTVTTHANMNRSLKWAWFRLGLYQMKYEDATSAVSSLQVALRLDPSDSHCWECLGEAYSTRGSYTAALKAFTKALELNPAAVYCSYQLAAIKQKLGQFEDAIVQYDTILQQTPEYVPALQGLGACHLHLTSHNLSRFLHGRAVLHCQLAISNLTRAAKLRPDLSCVWKFLGDACSILHDVPEVVACLEVPELLLSRNSSTPGTCVELCKKDLIALGSRCYATGLKLRPTMASLWHDLGVNYYYQAKIADRILAPALAQKSLEILKKSVTLDELNHSHWNALGVVAASKEISDISLAQHCFIKSIQVESNNVSAWTNLGTLYLANNHKELAHEAYKAAQSLEPNYISCWIGQALIAEEVADHHEAMDLFRHTTELGYHTESMIGYAHWVCQTLLDKSKMASTWYQYAVVQMNAVISATDALAKYLDRIPDDAVAWNMNGILLERQRLYRPATDAFARCMRLLRSDGSSVDTLLNVRFNYARVLCAAGNYEEAINQYRLLDKKGTLEVLCGLALSFYNSKNMQESCSAYTKALDVADNNDFQLVSVAIAMCAYKSENYDLAKAVLFKCVDQSSAPLLDVLKALLCLGLSLRDPDLITAVVKEFTKFKDAAYGARSDLVYLLAWSRLLLGDQRGAVSLLVSDIHRFPGTTACWTQLCQFLLLNFGGEYSSITDQCSQVALVGDVTARKVGLQCFTLAEHVSQRANSSRNAYQSAKKLVHLCPDDVSSWCVLLAAAHKENSERLLSNSPHSDIQAFILQYASKVLRDVELQLTHGSLTGVTKQTLQSLHVWCAQQYTLALVSVGQMEQAKTFLQQATWLYDSDEMLLALTAVINRDVESLMQLPAEDIALAMNQLQLALYFLLGMSTEAHGVYLLWKNECRYSAMDALSLRVEQHLLKLHLESGNEDAIQEILKIATQNQNDELLQIYDNLKRI